MKKILGITLLGVLGIVWGATCLAADEEPPPPATVEELDARLEEILKDTGTPGLIGTIVVGDEAIWTGAIGIAEREGNRAVTPATRFRVGSITKSFTSLAALILMERGQLDLEQTLHDFIPEAGIENRWRSTDPVRLYHVLEHTAGFDDIHVRDYAYSNPEVTLLEGIQFNTTSRIARWRPGTRMSYSNMGPAVGALAIEKATGEQFEDFVQREILDLLGMRATSYFHHADVAASYRADGTPEPYMHITVRPSGSMSATAADMGRFLKMFIHRGAVGGRQLIQQTSLERMELPVGTLAAKAGLPTGYGLSNASHELDRFHYQGHNGGIDGFVSIYNYMPEHARGYFLAINASNVAALRRADKAIRDFLTRDLDAPSKSPAATVPGIAGLAGYYETINPRPELFRWIGYLGETRSVSVDGNSLSIAPLFADPSRLVALNGGLFRQEDGAMATLAAVRSAEGEQLLQGNMGTARKIPAVIAWGRMFLAIASVLLIVSSLLFAVVWLVRAYVLSANIPALSIRGWPATTSVCILAAFSMLVVAQFNVIGMGKLTAYTGGYWLMTLVYAALAIYSVFHVLLNRDKRAQVKPLVWWHSGAVVAANFVVVAYLGYYGMIGLRFWAY